MLVIHRSWQQQLTGSDDATVPVADVAALDDLLDELHAQAVADGYPHAVTIYPGDHYPHSGYGEGDRWIPEDPGEGRMPELTLVVGTEESPLYWDEPAGNQLVSLGAPQAGQAADEDSFEYFYGGQESYAPRSSLVPRNQAREAVRLFAASGGERPAAIAWHAG
jgi:hypothetical protein